MQDSIESQLQKAIAQFQIACFSASTLFGLGVWMLLDPSTPERRSIERGLESIFKELWGTTFGFVLLAIAIPLIGYCLYKAFALSKRVWIKSESGYYYYRNKKRVKGLPSIWDGKDLVLFDVSENEAVRLSKFNAANPNEFLIPPQAKFLDCEKSYWSANEEGYTFIYKGRNDLKLRATKNGEDMLVHCDDENFVFKLPQYYALKDNKIREAVSL